MPNSNYWKERFKQLEAAQNRKGADTYLEIENQYRQAQKEIEGKINTWYQRFATNNNLSMAEARRMLRDKELAELKWNVKDYIKQGQANAFNGQWIKELENASARFHISRLEALKLQTQQSLELMFGNQLDSIDTAMKRIYLDGYYHTAYELQKGFGIGWDIAGLDQKKIEKVIRKPWAVDGKNFSNRIWSNKEKLISEVHREITQDIMLGRDPQKAIDNISKKMNTSKVNAGRLIMTEEAYFSSAAQKDCFQDLGVEQYEIVATLDSHTSDICQNLDGQVFPMKDFEPGVTAPPFHVYCRSTTVPYFEEDFGQVGKRAARGEDGKTYYVSADMIYKEWKKSFVDGGDKSSFNTFEKNEIIHGTEKVDYLVRSHTLGQDITKEKAIVDEVIASMPVRVQNALNNGTIIDIGKEGASQYDYIHDIMYIAKGAGETDVIHEIGHMVENKLLDSTKVERLKKNFLVNVPLDNIVQDIFYDTNKNPVEIFLLKDSRFVSEYQGRLYVSDWSEIYDENWNIKSEILQEFMSEPFREYIQNPRQMKEKFPQFYQMIEEALK